MAAIPALAGAAGMGAAGTAALGIGASFIGRAGDMVAGSKKARAENKARIKAYRGQVAQYEHEFAREVTAWNSDILDNEIEDDNNFKTKMLEQAKLDLGVWNAKRDASLAEQEALVAMHQAAGGANEQLGRRSQDSTSRRKAVLAFGTAMNRKALELSKFTDETDLNIDILDSNYNQQIHANAIEDITGQPFAGPPPTPPSMVKQPKFDWMGFAGDALGHIGTFNKAKAGMKALKGNTNNFANTGSGRTGGFGLGTYGKGRPSG